jgi:hypothetical protein
MISEDDSTFTHGRIPAHEFRESMNVSLLLLQAKSNLSRHQAMILGSCYYMSYDCFSCPYKFYELPKVDSPHNHFSSHGYYGLTGFWPEKVAEITRECTLIPPVIKCRSTGCIATKDLAIFVLIRRWHIPGNWEGVSRDLHQQRGWCI